MDQEQIAAGAWAQISQDVYLPALIKRASELGVPFETGDDIEAGLENLLMLKASMEQINVAESSTLHNSANRQLKDTLNIDDSEKRVQKSAAEILNTSNITPETSAALDILFGS